MLSCGSNAAPDTPLVGKRLKMYPQARKRLAYETFREKRASLTELQRPTTGTQTTPLEKPMHDGDNRMANHLQRVDPFESSAPSTLMEPTRDRAPDSSKVSKSKSFALHNIDLDEIQIPEMHEGVCRVFCQPKLWSPAFASPGDFTIKMASVFQNHGEVCFCIATMCCCARSICDDSRVKPATKRQYYISYTERTQREVAKLTEALSLQYIGHCLADKMPTYRPRLIQKQRALDEYGEQVIQFLSFVMQITATGLNRLVTLKEPVSSNVRVRDFLGLALGFGEQTIVATSSCDARIERQDGGSRPVLPRAWLDVDPNTSLDVSCYGKWNAMKRTPSSHPHDNGNVCNDFGPLMRSRSLNWSGAAKCVRFIDPCYWFNEIQNDGSFTVEISSVSVMDGVAKYAITVLFFVDGGLEMTTVNRRYSEFDALSLTLETKFPSLHTRQWFPPKTFFRYLSASYLERRAALLQLFLERALSLSYRGAFNEKFPLTAEINVRDFLKLPPVDWIVVPLTKLSATSKAAQEDIRTNFSLSPTAASDCSPCFNLSPRHNPRFIPTESMILQYENLLLRRSDSM
ncbi:unnamed protein product [Peronospora belbahrii]|uniref:PX domain-containing protein n=1 Tax=Peronospora belbahrii TaxID=622444 RepID=A0AAU9KSF8_9STRA|nr:unnamed protein product [Peronospora belbahrii]CAH0519909.1 unnamed protein product [Peronospora belbahrii]